LRDGVVAAVGASAAAFEDVRETEPMADWKMLAVY
jgi:hypothetical protein